MIETERIRHAQERGNILRVLKEDFQQEMTSTQALIRLLDSIGTSLSYDGLIFHLQYLERSGYVKLWRARDLPHFRRDRAVPGTLKAGSILFAHLEPKGLHLLDALIPEDPAVAF